MPPALYLPARAPPLLATSLAPSFAHGYGPSFAPGFIGRPHPHAVASPYHDPSLALALVGPAAHTYGAPRYLRRVKPDYRRFCYSVGKADVPYASLPGGPLEGMPAWMSSMLV